MSQTEILFAQYHKIIQQNEQKRDYAVLQHLPREKLTQKKAIYTVLHLAKRLFSC